MNDGRCVSKTGLELIFDMSICYVYFWRTNTVFQTDVMLIITLKKENRCAAVERSKRLIINIVTQKKNNKYFKVQA